MRSFIINRLSIEFLGREMRAGRPSLRTTRIPWAQESCVWRNNFGVGEGSRVICVRYCCSLMTPDPGPGMLRGQSRLLAPPLPSPSSIRNGGEGDEGWSTNGIGPSAPRACREQARSREQLMTHWACVIRKNPAVPSKGRRTEVAPLSSSGTSVQTPFNFPDCSRR